MSFTFTPNKGIRFYQFPQGYNPTGNWVHQCISWQRTYTEWMLVIHDLRKPVFGGTQSTFSFGAAPAPLPYVPNTVPDIWHHRTVAAAQIEECFLANQVIRHAMRRLLLAWRRRRMNRHVVGEEADVGTMEFVRPSARVYVYDWASRSYYCFHVTTIHASITAALRYQSMAISQPQDPKNPYTNLPWSQGQLAVLIDQIYRRMWDLGHRFMDTAIQAFYRCKLNMTVFKLAFGDQLEKDCARRFFGDPTAEYWDLIYEETLYDLILASAPLRPRTNGLFSSVIDRSLPRDLLEAWDKLVYGFWCYDNLHRMVLPSTRCIEDIYAAVRELFQKTEDHLIAAAEKRRAQRKKVLPRSRIGDATTTTRPGGT